MHIRGIQTLRREMVRFVTRRATRHSCFPDFAVSSPHPGYELTNGVPGPGALSPSRFYRRVRAAFLRDCLRAAVFCDARFLPA